MSDASGWREGDETTRREVAPGVDETKVNARNEREAYTNIRATCEKKLPFVHDHAASQFGESTFRVVHGNEALGELCNRNYHDADRATYGGTASVSKR